MPYVCRSCDYYNTESTLGACPVCGGTMRYTSIGPMTATIDGPAPREEWQDPYQFGYVEIETPLKFRWAQVGIGISTYYVFSRVAILLPFLFAAKKADLVKAAAMLVTIRLGIYCAAALAGGAAAGFWARDWVMQGICVAIGVSTLPILVALVFAPTSWSLVFTGAALTFPFAILGAYVGHKIVKPTRVPR